jgi:hypothetical protein
MVDKPTGGETEYDLLNTLVQDEPVIATHTAMIATDNPTWGICRCRMAAIINTVSRRFGWAPNERRVLTVARFPSIAQRQGLAEAPCHSTPPGGTNIPPNQTSGNLA